MVLNAVYIMLYYANVKRLNDYVIINFVFPYSLRVADKTLCLFVNGYDRLKLVKKE